jgi:hypothetical protein
MKKNIVILTILAFGASHGAHAVDVLTTKTPTTHGGPAVVKPETSPLLKLTPSARSFDLVKSDIQQAKAPDLVLNIRHLNAITTSTDPKILANASSRLVLNLLSLKPNKANLQRINQARINLITGLNQKAREFLREHKNAQATALLNVLPAFDINSFTLNSSTKNKIIKLVDEAKSLYSQSVNKISKAQLKQIHEAVRPAMDLQPQHLLGHRGETPMMTGTGEEGHPAVLAPGTEGK